MGDEEEPACKVQYLDGEKEYLELGYIKRPGKCRVNYLNGDSFVGSYNKFQKRTGEGAYTWVKDGEEEDEEGNVKKVVAQKYVGEYANGDKHGLGLMTYPNGDTYQGVFNKNRRHGDGTYTYAGTGDKYSGSWVDDKRQGWGVYVYAATGVQQVGEWSGGKCVNGKWLLPGGSSFHGRFGAGGKPAKGVYYFKGGNQQAGAFDSVLEDPEGDPEDPDAPRLNKWAGGAVLKASVEYAALRRPQADGTAADREALLVLEALEEAFVKFQANVRRLFYNAEVEALEPVMCKELQGRLAAEENADLMAMAEAAGRPRDYVLEAVGDSEEDVLTLKDLVAALVPIHAAVARAFGGAKLGMEDVHKALRGDRHCRLLGDVHAMLEKAAAAPGAAEAPAELSAKNFLDLVNAPAPEPAAPAEGEGEEEA